jgi:hypothetical protein
VMERLISSPEKRARLMKKLSPTLEVPNIWQLRKYWFSFSLSSSTSLACSIFS